MTECNGEQLEFHGFGRREVVVKFDGGMISSDGGGLLLREAIEHTADELVSQRILGLELGYEDLNHDRLRADSLLAMMVGKADPSGQTRARKQDKGKPLASSSTLNRLELTPAQADEKARYRGKRDATGERGTPMNL